MATYEITLEFETVLSVDGTRVKSETSRETQIVTGVFADVAVYISTQSLSDNMQRWIL